LSFSFSISRIVNIADIDLPLFTYTDEPTVGRAYFRWYRLAFASQSQEY
jgi:hypothetical protein